MTYLLCRGFGFTNDYWENLIPLLDDKFDFFADGFVPNPNEKYVGIGHSIGFLKLNNSGIKFKALIGLQGFLNFCGTASPKKEILQENLNRIIELFSKNPENSLKFFYKACGYEKNIPAEISQKRLISDLKMMKLSFTHCGAATLIIGSEQDTIVGKDILEDNFEHLCPLKFINGVNHTLGFSKPQEVYGTIKIFLNSLK